MEIKSNAADSQPSPLRYDLTKPNREAIQARQPLPAPPPSPSTSEPSDTQDPAQAVREARDAYRAKRQQRISNARAHYTATHAEGFAKEVTQARDAYRAKLDERKANVDKLRSQDVKGDRIDISADASRLAARLAEEARAKDAADEARTRRVEELKALHERGQLDADELIARAAHRMLGGD